MFIVQFSINLFCHQLANDLALVNIRQFWPANEYIKLRFTISQTTDNWDPLTIYDGSTDQSTQIAKLSGHLESFGIKSTGNSLFVRFKTHHYGNEDGFLAAIHYGNT